MKPYICRKHGLIEQPYIAPKLRNGKPHRGCPICRTEIAKKNNAERGLEYHRRWYAKVKDKERARQVARRREEKLAIIEGYGGKCVCCGEDNYEFLSVDHINKDGHARRKSGEHAGASFYRNLIKQGFPKDDLRLLCMNCNFSIGRYGYCPHEKQKLKKEAVA
jgi:hypothetical protein